MWVGKKHGRNNYFENGQSTLTTQPFSFARSYWLHNYTAFQQFHVSTHLSVSDERSEVLMAIIRHFVLN